MTTKGNTYQEKERVKAKVHSEVVQVSSEWSFIDKRSSKCTMSKNGCDHVRRWVPMLVEHVMERKRNDQKGCHATTEEQTTYRDRCQALVAMPTDDHYQVDDWCQAPSLKNVT